MTKIVGIKEVSFTGDKGDKITGKTFYYTYPLTGAGSDGDGCDHCFMTDVRLRDISYMPSVGDDVRLSYNRYGKVGDIFPA